MGSVSGFLWYVWPCLALSLPHLFSHLDIKNGVKCLPWLVSEPGAFTCWALRVLGFARQLWLVAGAPCPAASRAQWSMRQLQGSPSPWGGHELQGSKQSPSWLWVWGREKQGDNLDFLLFQSDIGLHKTPAHLSTA